MISGVTSKRKNLSYRILSCFIAVTFISNVVLPPAYAQLIPQALLNLPAPGTMISSSAAFTPPMISGITIHPENPLEFDFIVGTGDEKLQGKAFEEESTRLIKYFLASLTVPEDQMWVNLSPHEKDRIIPQSFGTTEMGRDLLAQDYILKQLTASLMYPEKELGNAFWKKIYQKAHEQYGTTEIPMNTFNKVWIVPQQAVVYEHGNSAFVVKSHLKVMLEEDYLAASHQSSDVSLQNGLTTDDRRLTTEIIREIILPEIEKEVNEGKTFANLRQIYNSVILAAWFKQNLKQTLLGQVYVDKAKTKGVDVEDKEVNQKIYAQYLEAFKKGAYNYIKEDYDPTTKEVIPRKYFSGGTNLKVGDLVQTYKDKQPLTRSQQEIVGEYLAGLKEYNQGKVRVQLAELSEDMSVEKAKEFIQEAQQKAALVKTAEKDKDTSATSSPVDIDYAYWTKKLELGEADVIHMKSLMEKFAAPKIPLVIGKNFFPSALLTDQERREWLGAIDYERLAQDATNAQAAKNATVTLNPMDGGLGTSIKREAYLEKEIGRAKDDPKFGRARLGAKATDLFFNVKFEGVAEPVKVSIAEIKLLRVINDAAQFGSVVFQPLVNKDSAPSYRKLLDSQYLLDRVDATIPETAKRTYRQVMEAKGVYLVAGNNTMLFQKDLPIIDLKTKNLTDNYTAPGGHGQWGVRLLLDAFNFNLPDDGKTYIRAFYNGDGIANFPDPTIVGWMAKENVPIVMISTTKTGADKKGGQLGIQILSDGSRRPQILELAQAKKADQVKLFGAIGLPGLDNVPGDNAKEYHNEAGKQYFNTNIAILNYNVLTPILKDLANIDQIEFNGEMLPGSRVIERIISPDLIENIKEKDDGKEYTQLEGAIGSSLLNLNAFFVTTNDERVKALFSKYGIEKFLRIVNVDVPHRTDFFTPVKSAFDFWGQAYSDYYAFDSGRWTLRDGDQDSIPPAVHFTGPKRNGNKAEDFYEDVQNVIDAFGIASTKELTSLTIEGRVLLHNAILKGNVEIRSQSPFIFDLNSEGARRALGQEGKQSLVLDNIKILITEDGSVSSEWLTASSPVSSDNEDMYSSLEEGIVSSPVTGDFAVLETPISELKTELRKLNDAINKAKTIGQSNKTTDKYMREELVPGIIRFNEIAQSISKRNPEPALNELLPYLQEGVLDSGRMDTALAAIVHIGGPQAQDILTKAKDKAEALETAHKEAQANFYEASQTGTTAPYPGVLDETVLEAINTALDQVTAAVSSPVVTENLFIETNPGAIKDSILNRSGELEKKIRDLAKENNLLFIDAQVKADNKTLGYRGTWAQLESVRNGSYTIFAGDNGHGGAGFSARFSEAAWGVIEATNKGDKSGVTVSLAAVTREERDSIKNIFFQVFSLPDNATVLVGAASSPVNEPPYEVELINPKERTPHWIVNMNRISEASAQRRIEVINEDGSATYSFLRMFEYKISRGTEEFGYLIFLSNDGFIDVHELSISEKYAQKGIGFTIYNWLARQALENGQTMRMRTRSEVELQLSQEMLTDIKVGGIGRAFVPLADPQAPIVNDPTVRHLLAQGKDVEVRGNPNPPLMVLQPGTGMTRKISDLEVAGQNVFLRVDHNGMFKDGKVISTQRINANTPTITQLFEMGARLVIMGTHAEKPEGKVVEAMSPQPVAEYLKGVFQRDVIFMARNKEEPPEDYLTRVKRFIDTENPQGILYLDNLRFDPREQGKMEDRLAMAVQLKTLADVYVDDAFSVGHRLDTSVYELAYQFAPDKRAAGISFQKELEKLYGFEHELRTLEVPKESLAVIAGSKLGGKDGKLHLLKGFSSRVNKLKVAGLIAVTFLKMEAQKLGQYNVDSPIQKAQGKVDRLKSTHAEKNELEKAEKELKDLQKEKKEIKEAEGLMEFFNQHKSLGYVAPGIVQDYVAVSVANPQQLPAIITREEFLSEGGRKLEDYRIIDVGPEELDALKKAARTSALVFWNGSLGFTDMKPDDPNAKYGKKATWDFAQYLATLAGKVKVAIGGGNTIADAQKAGLTLEEVFAVVLLGGGASQEFLIQVPLPGIQPLLNIPLGSPYITSSSPIGLWAATVEELQSTISEFAEFDPGFGRYRGKDKDEYNEWGMDYLVGHAKENMDFPIPEAVRQEASQMLDDLQKYIWDSEGQGIANSSPISANNDLRIFVKSRFKPLFAQALKLESKEVYVEYGEYQKPIEFEIHERQTNPFSSYWQLAEYQIDGATLKIDLRAPPIEVLRYFLESTEWNNPAVKKRFEDLLMDLLRGGPKRLDKLPPGSSPIAGDKKGGIDLNPALLDLQIRRDANFVPLPLPQQPIGEMHIDGFIPVIINITPVTNLPLLLGLADTQEDTDEASPAFKAREPEEISALN